MANILYYPQCSMYDKTTKQLLPEADGNINMMRNTINEWAKHRPQDKFYILLPCELSNMKYYGFLNINADYDVLFYYSYVVSARINRFNFPMNEFISILKDIKIDLIINDVIEVTSNFQQMFNIEFGYKPKIISNIRHLDDIINHYYMHRVLDGIIQSDIVTILSDSMKKKLDNQLRLISGNHVTANKVIPFEPSVSYKELELYKNNSRKNNNKVIIAFPGRLSIGEEKRTNWDKFERAIFGLRKRRQDFLVYLTDPNNSMSSTLKIGLVPWINTIPKNRALFLDLLNKTDIIVSLMDVEGFGGISIREALIFGCLPVIPKVHEYKKMAEDYYDGFVDSPIDVDKLEATLDWAITETQVNRHIYDFTIYGKQFTIEEQFKKLLPRIEELL